MIKVIQSGFYTTIQDLGRFGYQHFGVSVSGVMDAFSAKMANALLNNNENDAVLEMTMTGGTLVFECATNICVAGGDMSPKLNDISFKNNVVIAVKTSDVLSFGKLMVGFRAYLAVSGGFQTEKIMNSRSLFPHITKQQKLSKNDELPILKAVRITTPSTSKIKQNLSLFSDVTLSVHKGPEFEYLSSEQQELLFAKTFSISKHNNRMAYQLEEPFENQLKPIITSLVMPGTVQLTPSGQLIILMRDCQTTGGYPRVLQLTELSINKLAQKFTNQKIGFGRKE